MVPRNNIKTNRCLYLRSTWQILGGRRQPKTAPTFHDRRKKTTGKPHGVGTVGMCLAGGEKVFATSTDHPQIIDKSSTDQTDPHFMM